MKENVSKVYQVPPNLPGVHIWYWIIKRELFLQPEWVWALLWCSVCCKQTLQREREWDRRKRLFGIVPKNQNNTREPWVTTKQCVSMYQWVPVPTVWNHWEKENTLGACGFSPAAPGTSVCLYQRTGNNRNCRNHRAAPAALQIRAALTEDPRRFEKRSQQRTTPMKRSCSEETKGQSDRFVTRRLSAQCRRLCVHHGIPFQFPACQSRWHAGNERSVVSRTDNGFCLPACTCDVTEKMNQHSGFWNVVFSVNPPLNVHLCHVCRRVSAAGVWRSKGQHPEAKLADY